MAGDVLVPLGEHLAAVLALGSPGPTVRLGLLDAQGCVLAAPVASRHALPPFTSSAMDGYALRAVDTGPGGCELVVVGEVLAGDPSRIALQEGQAVRILTGAPLPEGADAVVAVEETDRGRERVRLTASVRTGQSVRQEGEECPAGALVLPAGRVVGAAEIAAAAGAGYGHLDVIRRPRVAVLTTGQELAEPGAPLRPGQVPDSNGPALAAAVRAAGGDLVALRRAGDDAGSVLAELEALARSCDLLLSTGGVSAGEENDPVRFALEARGSVAFTSVALQPGKPQAAGTIEGTAFLGFPGNPVSALVSFALFGRPLLRRLAGRTAEPARFVELGADVSPLHDKTRLVRAALSLAHGRLLAHPLAGRASHLVGGLGVTDACLVVPPGRAAVPAGTLVQAVSWAGADDGPGA